MLGIPNIILLSGAVCSGKTTMADWLKSNFNYNHIKTSDLLHKQSSENADRKTLQILGQKLDQEDPQWLLKNIIIDPEKRYVVDSIRIRKQAEIFREAYGRKVAHIHFEAPSEILEQRFNSRNAKAGYEPQKYEEVKENEIERNIDILKEVADICINTLRCRIEDVHARIAGLLGMDRNNDAKLVDVIIGGQYGSEGKGNLVSYLASEYKYIIRVGGPNAGHQTKDLKGNVHTFRQLPSGTNSSPETNLIIGPGATIDVDVLYGEIMYHGVGIDRLFIDPYAVIITEENKENEKALIKTISSTGSGSGCATAMRILNRSNPNEMQFAKNCEKLKPYTRPTIELLESAYREGQKILLEGTQGSGLSILHGTYPYVTSHDTNVAGCLSEAGISPAHLRKVIMVCRTYPIRVPNPEEKGHTSGPMAQEVSREEISKRSGLPLKELEELTSVTKKSRRISEFDWVLLKRSVALNSPTDIALTFVDYLSEENRKAYRYEHLTPDTVNFIEEVECITNAKVSLISTKFDHRSIIDRRTWR